MIGAIVGDIAGSRFEFHNRKSKDFRLLVSPGDVEGCVRSARRRRGDKGMKGRPLRGRPCFITDDTVMTLAVAEALVAWRKGGARSYAELSEAAVAAMRGFGARYPRIGYGGHFLAWLRSRTPRPYNSWGNGAAMRVSACGWAGRTLDEMKRLSAAVTAVTHNHPEGLKGAEATAVAVYLARCGKSKGEIRDVIVRDYYALDFALDDIRPDYRFDVSCQGSVPPALEAFFEAESFEDAIRNAISLGGDSDTLGAICGAVAGPTTACRTRSAPRPSPSCHRIF